MDQDVFENMKRSYKRDLLLHLLNQENEGLNIAQFIKTLTTLDAVMMSEKCCREINELTIAKIWTALNY